MCFDATVKWHEDIHQSSTSWLFRWMIGSTLEPILACGFKLMLSEDLEKMLLFAKCSSSACVFLIPAWKRKKNRLACDCLCHFVKFWVILGDLKVAEEKSPTVMATFHFFADVSVSVKSSAEICTTPPSSPSSLFTCSFVSPSSPWILKHCTFMRSAQGAGVKSFQND